jgi:hypothetical protein
MSNPKTKEYAGKILGQPLKKQPALNTSGLEGAGSVAVQAHDPEDHSVVKTDVAPHDPMEINNNAQMGSKHVRVAGPKHPGGGFEGYAVKR